MSNVQLSCSTLERLLSRETFPLHARTGVCRTLFGPIDHDELSREVKSKLREMVDRDRRKWNFNFETETPLSGNYEWEETPVDSTPGFYRDPAQTEGTRITVPEKMKPYLDVTRGGCIVHDAVQDSLPSSESTLPRPSAVNQKSCSDRTSREPNRKSVSCNRMKRTTAAHITDFYMKRKRISEVTPNENAFQHSTQVIPVERNPRKVLR